MQEPSNQIPIKLVGSSTFGIYPKISLEKTYNMFVSDNWLINYAGYKRLTSHLDGREGRGIFHSIRGDFYIVVIDDKVYKFNKNLGGQKVGSLNTRFGEVFMDENLTSQICIVDGNNAWIYNYSNSTFTKQQMDVGFDLVPGYVEYQNSFFLITPSINDPNNTNNWYAFQRATDSTISLVLNSVFPLQTKPDHCLAVKRLPGRGNHVLVIGSSVCEVFSNVGGEENYRRNSSFNIDSGCVSISTIAANEQFICFLAQNENNSPTLIYTNGTEVKEISTDGINNLLKNLSRPDKSTAFFYKQDGHLFYQITFFDDTDNLSLAYDFSTNMFFHVTDDAMNFHPARQIIYFNGKNLFVGLKHGSIYEMSIEIEGAFDDLETGKGRQIPRIRVTNTVRSPNSNRFFCNEFSFWMEQGINSFSKLSSSSEMCFEQMVVENFGAPMLTESGDEMITENGYCANNINNPCVDMSLSKNGNQSFSNIIRHDLNPEGIYRNKVRWHRLGIANELTIQLRFWGLNRFVVNNGILKVN